MTSPDIGRTIKALRALRGWTQPDLAAAAGLSPATIVAAEKRPNTVSRGTILAIAEALCVPASTLLNPLENAGKDGVTS